LFRTFTDAIKIVKIVEKVDNTTLCTPIGLSIYHNDLYATVSYSVDVVVALRVLNNIFKIGF